MNSNQCQNCTFVNETNVVNCEMCGLPQTNSNLNLDYLNKALDEIAIQKNYEKAYETIPESFFPISMLYFNCSINGFTVKAFIDTGAQSSIMNLKLAKKIGCEKLIDKKYKGKALGVGTQSIYGKIHLLDIDIIEKDISLPCAFLILKNMDVDMIFGLDMLLSHGIVLNLKNKHMLINDIVIDFV